MDYILSFADFIKKWGYNTLVLYLEGRIKTKSFPYMGESESYSPQEIKEVVDYCADKSIQVIPVVPSLGHTEMFLRYPELEPIAELRPDEYGRFSRKGVLSMTCPSKKETFDFFESYYSEIASLFTCKYFHAGLDESWDIGMCSVCKQKMEKDGRADYIFSDYIKRIYEILKNLDKTMMMWDDMFEIYPNALYHIPKGIVMCRWCYSYFVNQPVGHFLHLQREDIFRKYDELGYKYMFCTNAYLASNITSFTRYAKKYRPLGGLVTVWEKKTSFNFEHYPMIAYAGKLWSSNKTGGGISEESFLNDTISRITKTKDPLKLETLKTYFYLRRQSYMFSSAYTYGEILPGEVEHYEQVKLLYNNLKNFSEHNSVVEDILITLNEKILKFEVRKLLTNYISNGFLQNEKLEIDSIIRRLKVVEKARIHQWDNHRKGITSDVLKRYFRNLYTDLRKLVSNIETADYFLHIRFFLPDVYSCPFVNLNIKDINGSGICVISNASLKPPMEELSYYEYVFPLKIKRNPLSLRIGVYGYGGQGLSFVKIIGKEGEFLPKSITDVEGVVLNPTHVLKDNLQWCYLGEHESKRGFIWNEYERINHCIEISFQKIF